MCTGIWWGQNERDDLEDLGVEGGTVKMDLHKIS